jgi:GTP-binding protein Era
MKSGFVNIFGKPNAGKSTLLNALMGEKLAIISHKVQTTRHRIKGILTGDDHQIIFSDTPGIIEPKYRLHEKMMHAVRSALQDGDLALLIVDANDNLEENDAIFSSLRLRIPAILVINKIDHATTAKVEEAQTYFEGKPYLKEMITISAIKKLNLDKLMERILFYIPEGEPFFDDDNISDLSTRFFVGELIREKIYDLFEDEIPYHTAVLVQEYTEKSTLVKIRAEIIVQRDTQKGIILGGGGKMIKKLGQESRLEIEKFIGNKVFLELFVKVRPKWRDNDLNLREYGYN